MTQESERDDLVVPPFFKDLGWFTEEPDPKDSMTKVLPDQKPLEFIPPIGPIPNDFGSLPFIPLRPRDFIGGLEKTVTLKSIMDSLAASIRRHLPW